jgi:hypothetical protein
MEIAMMTLTFLRTAMGLALSLTALCASAADYPAAQEGDWVARDFRFHTGEVLPELRLHYTTVGEPSGQPVLILHGTTGSGAAMLSPAFAGELFGLGQPLAAFGPRVGQHRGGGQVLDPPGPGELVHVGGDAIDDRGHPRQVDGHEGPVRPVGGRAQAGRWRVAISVQVREPACALPQPAHLIG